MNIDTTKAILRAEGLCKRYGKQTVLDGLNLEIRPGCIYGLIGRNGAGKTTLMSILTGQNSLDAGSVTYGGQPVWENRNALRHLCFSRELSPMGYATQNALRVRDYLDAARLFFPLWDADYAARLIQRFELDPKKAISKLSKGQMSMVTILLALASRAPMTILDEPVAGLDVVAREDFYRLLLEDYTATGRTFVISTHILEEASNVFERVIVLDEGHVIAECPTDALLEEFRLVSGEADVLNAAVAEAGGQTLAARSLGRHKLASVRGGSAVFEALSRNPALTVEPMSLQNVFVALCGHEREGGAQ